MLNNFTEPIKKNLSKLKPFSNNSYWPWTELCQTKIITEDTDFSVFQMPLIIPISYAVMTFTLLVIALISAPKKTGMGLLILLATSVPYYLLFVKEVIKSTTLRRYSGMANVFYFEDRGLGVFILLLAYL